MIVQISCNNEVNPKQKTSETGRRKEREYHRIARVRSELMDEIHRWPRSRRSMSLRWRVEHWDCREWDQWESLSFDCWSIRDDEASTDYFEDRRINLETHRHIHHHDSSHDCPNKDNCPTHHSFDTEMLVESIDCIFRLSHSSILVDNWWKCLRSIDCSRTNTSRRDADHRRHSVSLEVVASLPIRSDGWIYHREIHRDIEEHRRCTTTEHEDSTRNSVPTKSNIDPQCRSNQETQIILGSRKRRGGDFGEIEIDLSLIEKVFS